MWRTWMALSVVLGGCVELAGEEDSGLGDLGSLLGDDDDDAPVTGTGCDALAQTADERLASRDVQCIEGTFEEGGYAFDAAPCDDLEDALASGFGAFDSLWSDCRAAEGFGDSDCDAVLESCF